jgi:hypothetical protein
VRVASSYAGLLDDVRVYDHALRADHQAPTFKTHGFRGNAVIPFREAVGTDRIQRSIVK